MIARSFESVDLDQWSCPGQCSNGSAFAADSLERCFLHDLVYHLHDVSA